MSDYDLRIEQLQVMQSADYTPDEPENEDPPKKSMGMSVYTEGLMKNGINGVASAFKYDKYIDGNTLNRNWNFNVEAGSFVGAGAEYRLSKQVKDNVSVFGSAAVQARLSFDGRKNIAMSYSEDRASIDGEIEVQDAPITQVECIYNDEGYIVAELITEIPQSHTEPYHKEIDIHKFAKEETYRNDLYAELSTGVKYTGEKGSVGASVGVGVRGQVMPYAKTTAKAYSDPKYDQNGYIIPDESRLWSEGNAESGKELQHSSYLFAGVDGKFNFAEIFALSGNAGVQVNLNDGAVRPYFGVTFGVEGLQSNREVDRLLDAKLKANGYSLDELETQMKEEGYNRSERRYIKRVLLEEME